MKKIYSLFLALFFSASVFAAGHTVTITSTNVTCYGMTNGSATASVSGGVGPFTYDWSPIVGTTATITGLSAGAYSLIVTDNSDMSTATANVTITQPPLLTVGLSGAVQCTGSCSTLNPLVSGGTPPYTYSWTGGIFGPSPTVCLATSTTYTVTITDANGCIATDFDTVFVYATPVVTSNSPTICSGLTATLTGGGASTYLWSTGAAVNSIIVSPASTTTYTVTGTSGGCTATAVSTVTVVPLPVVTASSSTVCSGDTAFVNYSGATTYTWTAGLWAYSGGTAYSIPSTTTTYTITGTTSGCVGTTTATVTVVPSVIVTLPSSYFVCSGGAVCMSASATGGAIAYSWSPVTALSASTIANPCSAPIVTTTYTVAAANGSCVGTATTTVIVNGPITSGITSTNTTGCGICDGTATLSPSGGTPPYFPSWGGMTITGICPGTYVGTITDAAGCTITDSTTIFTNNDVIANFTMVPDSTDPYNFFAFNTSTGGGLSYSWYWADGSPDPGTANPSHYYPALGTYNICLTVSNALCGADTLCEDLVVTGVSTPCNALFNIADDTINPDPNAHYVYNLSYGATLSYLWDFGDGTTSTLATPSHVYASTGPYLLCLSIDNGSGCTDMFCDSLISADSLNRSSGIMQLTVYDVPTFYSVATGINNAIAAENVKVAPNPFNETTIFTVNTNEIYSFELTDVLGKKVRSKTGISEKQFEISRNGLENGIYFYKIYTFESVIGIGKVVIK